LTILSNAIRQQHIKQQKTAASNLKFEQNKRMIDVQHETRCKIEIGSTKDVLLIYIYIYIYMNISHTIYPTKSMSLFKEADRTNLSMFWQQNL
jgi:hypothetical protein